MCLLVAAMLMAIPSTTPSEHGVLSLPGFSPSTVAVNMANEAVQCDSVENLTQLYSIQTVPFVPGDTDHDGRLEVIGSVQLNGQGSTRILEEQGDNVYSEVFVGPAFVPYVTGDFDSDGNAEILGQIGSRLVIYESPDPSSHPSVLTWQSPPLTNIVGYATAGDTDGDGLIELIHSANTLGPSTLLIYENTGNNAFSLVYSAQVNGIMGPKLVADLRGDERPEIALCGDSGQLYVFEALGNNSWQQLSTVSTGLDNALAVTGGKDTDGNGKCECFVSGNPQPGSTRTKVYEYSSADILNHVEDLDYVDGYSGIPWNTVADIDADGRYELVVEVFANLLIYRATALETWILDCMIPAPGSHSLFLAYDANQNGRTELLWSERGSANIGDTVVLEYPEGSSTSVEESKGWHIFSVYPNPSRNQATLLLRECPSTASSIATFDVAGRLVSRVALRPWAERMEWPHSPQAPGVYFIQLENADGTALARRRVTLLR